MDHNAVQVPRIRRIRPPKDQHWVCLGFNPIRFRSRKNLSIFNQSRRRQLKKGKHWRRKDFILYLIIIFQSFIFRVQESQRIIRCNPFALFNALFHSFISNDKKRNVSKRDTITKFITIKNVLSYFFIEKSFYID